MVCTSIMNRFFKTLWLCCSAPIFLSAADVDFHIVIPSYNNNKVDAEGKNWIEKNLASVFEQTYPWTLTYINDASTDGTGEVAEIYALQQGMQDRCTFINNETNQGALANLYNVISACPRNQIIVLLDGDDELATKNVLERVAKEYQAKNAWITYGSYVVWPCNKRGLCKAYSKKEIRHRDFRKLSFRTSHLRTFYAGLFQKIRRDDMVHDGKFFGGGWDLIIMFPMLEMASKGHIRYIKDILYHWNCTNPLSDCRVHSDEQKATNKWVRTQPKYKALDTLFDAE